MQPMLIVVESPPLQSAFFFVLRRKDMVSVKPLGDRALVKPKPREEKTKGGIFLPDTATKERPMQGEVLSVGEGRLDDDGKRIPMSVKPGDQVLFAKYAGTEFEIDDEEYLILSEKDILGIIVE
jgi:chaperonin GroES